jgi:DNA-binding GntR family transcriptional regulator
MPARGGQLPGRAARATGSAAPRGGRGSGAVSGPGGGPSSASARSQRKLIAFDAEVPQQRAAAGVLADRIAAALVHREPGWRLPRRSALARRYNVSIAEIDAAVGELARRSLIRRLPDGQLYRASPAEYLIPVEGIGGLSTRLDPMGGELTCQARHVSQRGAPQDVAWALGVDGDAPVRVVRCVWATGAEPVALSTAYVPEAVADSVVAQDLEFFEAMLRSIPPGGLGPATALAKTVDLELAPPQPSVARSLRLVPGQPAISVTVRFDDPVAGTPVGLTVVILKPAHFRVVVQIGDPLAEGAESGNTNLGSVAKSLDTQRTLLAT